MKKDINAMIPFLAGIIIAGFSYWLSEAPFLDDRIKYPDAFFNKVQIGCTIGMVVGVLVFAYGAVKLFTIWKRDPE